MKNFDFYYPNNNCKVITNNIKKVKSPKRRKKLNRIEILFNFRNIVGKIISKLKNDDNTFKKIANKDKHLQKTKKKY